MAGIVGRLSRALSRDTSRTKEKEYPKWPADHPYAYTIGDVEYRTVPDLKTGEDVKLLFGLNKWPKRVKSDNLQVIDLAADDMKVEETRHSTNPNFVTSKLSSNLKTGEKAPAATTEPIEEKKHADGTDAPKEGNDEENTSAQKKKKDKKKKSKDKSKPVRKVFVSFKVKRVSDIENVEQQFRIRFHLYFNWLPTHSEYISFLKHRENPKKDKMGSPLKWEPRWYPHLEFMNQIDSVLQKWEEYPDEGCFRLQKLKTFFRDDVR